MEGDAVPLEAHDVIEPMLLSAWLSENVRGFNLDRAHPICIEVAGSVVLPEQWPQTIITPDIEVRIFPEARAGAAVVAAWAAVALAAISIVMVLTMPKAAKASKQQQGDDLDAATATGNHAKLNSPIRELLGMAKVYPDLLVPPVSRFENKRIMRTSLCLSVSRGHLSIPPSSIKIGDTPVAAFGSDVNYSIYEPGESLGADIRTQNWYPVTEVGGTNAGTAGLDLSSTAPADAAVIADSLLLSGSSISLLGNAPKFPEVWASGTVVRLVTPDTYTVTSAAGYSKISGQFVDLYPFVGMKVTLKSDDELDLIIASYSPYVPPVAGVGGTPSAVLASAAPSTYDFTGSAVVWTITFNGIARTVSLSTNYTNMSGLIASITAQLTGSGLVAQDNSGRVRLVEPLSPYKGGPITQSSAPVQIFGSGPTYTVGTASSGGTAEQAAFITLKFDNGTPFTGVPPGQQRIAIGYRGLRFKIASISGFTATLQRLTDAGLVDTAWGGFTERTLLDFMLTGSGGTINWIGSFMGCPENELATESEYDIFFSQGLCYYNKTGKIRTLTRSVEVQWRDAALAGAWNSITHTYTDTTADQIGFTHKVVFPYPLRPEFRMRRVELVEGGQVRDAIQWYGLRSRLPAPASYAGITVIAFDMRGGDRLSAQSERQISCVPTRIYDNAPARSIKGAALHVCQSLGIDESLIDMDAITATDLDYWSPRGELYDMSHEKAIPVREALQGIFTAGMSHLSSGSGLLSVKREGIQPARGVITPHEMTSELTASFTAPSPDDFDGVDVEYIDQYTNRKETVPCRLDGSLELKVDKIQLDGVSDRTRAWRIGMRQLRKYQFSRWGYSVDTEMDALVFDDIDRITLADDIPNTTSSALITEVELVGGQYLLTLSEEMDWSMAAPRAVIRRHDGTVTSLFEPMAAGFHQVLVPSTAIDFDIVTDLSIEPARFLFGPSEQVGYPAMITEITPNQDGTCAVTAAEYSPVFYADDDNEPRIAA
ncbi:host specificity factor TipJ family phage tail protein [Pseudomonas sp. IT-P294]|uniref:host specificity factor TipJ family phage tail protein n=1 Tax=Pseudomonas sp. IT-P294 TaxID=3026454 RepID=UPI0039E11265